MVTLSIKALKFTLPEVDNSKFEKSISKNAKTVEAIGNKAGQGNPKFERSINFLKGAVKLNKSIEPLLVTPIDARAYAVAISEGKRFWGRRHDQYLNVDVLSRLRSIRDRPSGLLVESLTKQYFQGYDEFSCYKEFAEWLLSAKVKRNQLNENMKFLLSSDGPKAVAERCIKENVDFTTLADSLGLNAYGQGRYLNVAQLCYYIGQLVRLQPNEPSELFTELMQPSAYNAPFTATQLLGHKALEIIIDKVPAGGELSPQWEKFILSIAGDPRIPKDHPNYRKWWTPLGEDRVAKVRSWLSKLDLKIFLEILEQYARSKGGADMQRMYPPRKQFLEGLFKAKLVKGTRLFLSAKASEYAKGNYKKDELPNYSLVTGNPASIIAIQVGDHWLVEGSHSCRLWLYKSLSPRAIIHDYKAIQPSYYQLTQNLDAKNQTDGYTEANALVHTSTNWNWQHKAIKQLQEWGIKVTPKDVIPPSEINGYIVSAQLSSEALFGLT